MSNRLSRRGFLAAGSAYGSCMLLPRSLAANSAGANGDSDLTHLSARTALTALRRGDITAERYAQALLDRCRSGARLNAFITLRPEQVLQAARERDRERRAGKALGPLHGLPIPIKDSVNTADLPTTAGTPALRHFQPREDAPLVRALRTAGAIVLGKTNLHELSYGYTSNNHAFGAILNPYDPTRIPGGSSGGSGASIAYRMAPLGIAEDTEGSIRVPAAMCGIAGFRPTTGRYPSEATVPTSAVCDQLGPHARSVADLLLFDEVLTGRHAEGPAPPLQGVRLGVVRGYFYTGLDPEVERVTDAALERLRRAGAVLVEGELPQLAHYIDICTNQILNHDVRPSLSRYLADYHTGISFETLLAQASPDVRRMIEPAITRGSPDFVTDEHYRHIMTVDRPALQRMYRDYFQRSGVTAIVFPTTIVAAPPLGEEDRELQVRGRRIALDDAIARNIAPGSTTGLPGLVLPAGLTASGLPVGLEFDGPAGSDASLLQLGLALEHALGTLPPPRDL